ncbi:endonuclease G, mitochondrial [Drosophila serrata]|uniref:endonuclease G, mitochondrial n=1 Tax=Drosophila serrata TaxID=7274 RepID=UPI000A1D19C7|nr:endonuclease G, mitochondrial [Drosophila serrata]
MYGTAAMFVITGTGCFMLGALAQQTISHRRIRKVMLADPYVFKCRNNIFQALAFLGIQRKEHIITSIFSTETVDQGETKETQPSKTKSREGESIFTKLGLWSRTQANKMVELMPLPMGLIDGRTYKSKHVDGIMKYGFPGVDEIHVYKNFVLSYDRRNRIPHWVCEHVKEDCFKSVDEKTLNKPNEYMMDSSIATTFSPNMRDFRNSDWVGGHMASPHNYKCDYESFAETYMFPNITPISRDLKNHLWRRLQIYVRELAEKYGSVHVYTGPLFMPQRISFRNWAVRHHVMGMNTVAVPTHFFKIIICELPDDKDDLPTMEGFVVPNAAVDKEMDLRAFLSDIRDIEHFAGLKFYEGKQGILDETLGNTPITYDA